MAVAWSDVVLIAPDLSTVPISTQTLLLASAQAVMSIDSWGTRYDLGLTWLAAHLGTLYQRGDLAGTGQVKTETVGKVTREYEIPQAVGPDGLALTWYGEFYYYLMRTLVKARIFLVV